MFATIFIFALALFFLTLLFVLLGIRIYDNQKVELISQMLRAKAAGPVFDTSLLAGLPSVVQKYFLRSIKQGAPLAASTLIRLKGKRRDTLSGAMRSFHATQVLGKHGFVWQGRIAGFPGCEARSELYAAGHSRILGWFCLFFPLVIQYGDVVARNLGNRAIIERCWLPSLLLPQEGVRWEAVSEHSAKVYIRLEDGEQCLHMSFDGQGRLESIQTKQWFTPEKNDRTFLVKITEWGEFGDYTIPVKMQGGWLFEPGNWVEIVAPEVEAMECG